MYDVMMNESLEQQCEFKLKERCPNKHLINMYSKIVIKIIIVIIVAVIIME